MRSSVRAALSLPLAVLLVVSCGGSGKKAAAPSASPVSTSATPSAAASATAGTLTGEQAEVAHAWVTFFAPNSSLDTKVSLLQRGPTYRSILVAQSKTSAARLYSMTVSAVTVHGDSADVVFDIHSGGSVVLAKQSGQAVREGGVWKVSADNFCALISLNTETSEHCPKS
jgi:hypothetical protein